MPGTDALPYAMPSSRTGKIEFLRNVLELERSTLSAIPESNRVPLLVGIILYRHLNARDKREVMAMARSLPGPVRIRVMPKILDPMITPSWGVWSLSTKELLERRDFLDRVSEWGGHLGLSFSFAEGVSLIRKVRNPLTKLTPLALMTVVIWGYLWVNDVEREKLQRELDNRLLNHP